MCDQNLADYHWLVSDNGQRWLRKAGETSSVVSLAKVLRSELSPSKTHLVLQQLELRRRARRKFSQAQRMFFTPNGLEQATDERIADYKASRFPRGGVITDLCCGVGGDLLALSKQSPAIGIDIDQAAALFAQTNLRLASGAHPSSRVERLDVAAFPVESATAWHIDPDRRSGGRRCSQPHVSHPSLATLEGLWKRCPRAAIKLAPAAQPQGEWLCEAEREWIESRGECRQQVVWLGDLAGRPSLRTATIIPSSADEPPWSFSHAVEDRSQARRSIEACSIEERVLRYVYEPHNAVLASGLAPALAEQFDLRPLDPDVAYWMGDAHIHCPGLTPFQVMEVLPMDKRRVQAALSRRGIGQLEIKRRHAPIDPLSLKRHIGAKGNNHAVLLVTRLQRQVIAIIARRPS